MKKIKLNKRDILALCILACLIVAAFVYAVNKSLQEYKFANQMENLYTKNEKPVFTLDKIVTYSSANAIDNSEGKTLQDLDVCQFTDIAIYIDNMANIKELVKEANAMNASTINTDDEASKQIKEHSIKELYIDKIKINTASNKGTKILSYKDISGIAKFVGTDVEPQGRIDFEIVSTNVENEKKDYTKPTFYADCSNPITLGYLNKNIVTNYAVSDPNTQIKFDGSILKSVGIPLSDLEGTINFDIHMKNNFNQNFTCNVSIDIPLSSQNRSIYDGYLYSMENELQNKYKFFKN